MQITYYGHACFMVTVNHAQLLFDPFIKNNPLASHIDIKTINPTHIFISHGHADHLADALTIAEQSQATIYAIYEVANYLTEQGAKNVVGLNIGAELDLPFGLVKCFKAVHSSSLPNGQYGGVAAGFACRTPQNSFYYSGDTALTYDMALVSAQFDLQLAILPIGNTYTMGVNDAVEAAKLLKCDKIMGVHYDTFPAIEISNKLQAAEKFAAQNIELYLPAIGDTIHF
jgi:L-ascorbate metabolism protein UlaG (beta-lactamase superfamily)